MATTRLSADVSPGFAGQAFGIGLESDFRVPGLLERPDAGRGPRTDRRRLQLALNDAASADASWPAGTAERTFELSVADGPPAFTIDRDPDAGYRVWIDGLGLCVIAPEGDRIVYAPTHGPARWELLIGQGLPIAAALQGLEVLHASAVSCGALAFAFVAPSGTGKTSLALHLLAHGAGFLADDVVALEAEGERLLTHPGIGLANAPQAERASLQRAGVHVSWPQDPGVKHHVNVALPPAPLPLGAIYFLERTRAVDATEIASLDPPDPCLLLSATFVSHVPTAARLITQLDICSRIARTVPLFHVRVPAAGRAADLARSVAQHIETVA